MKVLHVVNNLDPRLGGSVEAARLMACGMAEHGAQVEVLSLVEPQRTWLDHWPVPVHGLGNTHTSYLYTPRLGAWLGENAPRFDAVIVHGIWRYASAGVARVLRNQATPFYLYIHGMLDPWFASAYFWKHRKKVLFWKALEHRSLRDARAVLFTNQEEMELAGKTFRPYRCRGKILPYGPAPPPGDPRKQREAFLERFPETAGSRVILSLGRIHRKKGCDLLIQAFADVAHGDPRLRLVLAGPDDESWKPALVRLSQEAGVDHRLTWTGHLEGDVKWGAFYAADVFALPSHGENYGISVVEALSCSLPVLISHKVNIWREIVDDGAGLAAADDLPGTVATLREWLRLDPTEFQDMRDRARHCFDQRFELRGCIQRLLDFLMAEAILAKAA